MGTAALGGARPDVASAFNRSDFTNSGWNFHMSTSSLSAGLHSVTVSAAGVSGSGQLVGNKTINILTTQAQEIGFVDLAGDVSGVSTVSQGQILFVEGWAADTAAGAPVQSVTVFVDGISMGTAALGGARPDVAVAFNRSDYTNSGWNFHMSTGALIIGAHSVTATAVGSSGTAQLVGSKVVNVVASPRNATGDGT